MCHQSWGSTYTRAFKNIVVFGLKTGSTYTRIDLYKRKYGIIVNSISVVTIMIMIVIVIVIVIIVIVMNVIIIAIAIAIAIVNVLVLVRSPSTGASVSTNFRQVNPFPSSFIFRTMASAEKC